MADIKQSRVRYKVDEYPPEAKETLERLLADIRFTYTEIAEEMTARGWPMSKSSIHRYAARTQAAADRLRAAAEQTRILIQAVKDGQDLEAGEVASAMLLDRLTERIATAEEEFDELPLDKAGRLLVQLQRTSVYKARWKAERKKTIEALREGMLSELRGVIQEDDELLERLTAIVDGVARREAAKDE